MKDRPNLDTENLKGKDRSPQEEEQLERAVAAARAVNREDFDSDEAYEAAVLEVIEKEMPTQGGEWAGEFEAFQVGSDLDAEVEGIAEEIEEGDTSAKEHAKQHAKSTLDGKSELTRGDFELDTTKTPIELEKGDIIASRGYICKVLEDPDLGGGGGIVNYPVIFLTGSRRGKVADETRAANEIMDVYQIKGLGKESRLNNEDFELEVLKRPSEVKKGDIISASGFLAKATSAPEPTDDGEGFIFSLMYVTGKKQGQHFQARRGATEDIYVYKQKRPSK